MKFKLQSEFSPTGDQPTAIKQLTEGLNNGEISHTLLGVTGSGNTFNIANVIKEVKDTGKLVALEICEINPLLDNKGNQMAESAFEIISSVLS